jgi:nucleoside-diphosphate-sugar epimerase
VSRVLLTGASGFIGGNLLRLLTEQGDEVHAVSRRAGEPLEGVHWHELDMLEEDAVGVLVDEIRPERMVHLAWYATPGSFWTAAENELWIGATLRLLRAFAAAGGRRAVVAGTCAEYRWGAETLVERQSPLEPATLYGACKLASFIACTALAEQLGVSLAWGRVFFLYGLGEDPRRLVSGVVRGLLAGDEVPTTDGTQRRDFMHVRDVAGAFAAILGSDVEGPVNIASGRAVAVREIIEMIGRETGAGRNLRVGALPQRAGEPAVIEGANNRLLGEVGFVPAVGLEDGIRETVESWRGPAPST